MKNKYYKIIDLYFANDDIARNNANFVRSISNLEGIVLGELMGDYLLDVIYEGLPTKILDREGYIYHHQKYKISPYSYSGKNILILKIDGEIKLLSFEDAYNYFNVDEVLIDAEKRVYQKDISSLNVEALDRRGWTKVLKITKKKRTKDILVLKTRNSEMIEITDDHPVIIGENHNEDIICAKDVIPFKHKQYKISIKEKLEKEKLFKVEEIDMINYINEEDYLIYENYLMKKGNKSGFIKRKIKLTKELGYIIGFILAEGCIRKPNNTLVIVNKNENLLRKFLHILFEELGVVGYLEKKENAYQIRIQNDAFLEFIKLFAKANYYSDGKHLNEDILRYSKEFVLGIIGGIIDGDGTVSSNGQILLRITSGKLVYQLAYILRLFGFYPTISYQENKVKETEKNKITQDIQQRRDIYALAFTVRNFIESEEIPSYKFEKAKNQIKNLQRNVVFYKENEWVNIQSIKKIENDFSLQDYEYVYDITTESETFILHGFWVHNCIGLSAKDIAMFGLQSNSKNGIKAKPPKRLETLFMQCANLICLIAQEVSGATSLNDLSTIGAGYLYILEKQGKKYSDYELKNIWQEFLFNINLPFRTGNHSPFSNITLEFGKPNPHLAEEYVIYAGQVMSFKYKDIPSEYYDRIVNAFIDAMYEGDADGKPFTFPLITVNIYDNFDWNNKTFRKLLEKSEYFGGLYFQNYTTKPFNRDSEYKKLNPYLEPFDLGMIYSNCCRMCFSINDVIKYTGSNPFHSNSGIGGIGVININLNRILFLTKDNFEYFKTIFDYLFDISAKTLQRKREFIRKHWEDLYPYLSFYQKNDKSLFNIISIVGVHEGLINAGFKDGLKNEEGKKYAVVLAKYIRDKIEKAIEEYGELFNLEYAPSEYAGCKLAEKDLAFAKKVYDYLNGKKDIIFTEDEYLNNIIKKIVDKQGSKIFDVINL